ncbi:hypothetical protein ACFFQF_00825 [Haladaptatus pallidirubidus]|uniref:hypothetical protein n=1 Tax=Haladaptatus pallidirubidus TaxID=1008152 RepID=UPI0035E97368
MQNNSYEYENGLCQPVEFATISAANWVRDQFFDAVRPEDDARTLEVVLSADTPKHCMDEIIRVQRESFEEVEGHKYGQEPLTSFEKSKLLLESVAVPRSIGQSDRVILWRSRLDRILRPITDDKRAYRTVSTRIG